MPRFSLSLEKTLYQAVEIAQTMSHEYVTVEHLLLALIDDKDAREVMLACGVDVEILRLEIKEYLTNEISTMSLPKIKSLFEDKESKASEDKNIAAKHTPSFQRVILRAVIHVQSSEKEEVTGAHILVSIFSEPENFAAYFLHEQEMTKLDAMNYMSHGIRKEKDNKIDEKGLKLDISNKESLFFSAPQGFSLTNLNAFREQQKTDPNQQTPHIYLQALNKEKETLNGASPNGSSPSGTANTAQDRKKFIETYCVNLNEKAKLGKIDPLVGRIQEIDRIIHILSRRNKNNPLLVGEPGVGKTAIIEGLALLIHSKKVPAPLRKATIFSLDIGALLAGTRYRGDFEERFKNLLKALMEYDGAILFIDEIHTIIGAGAANGSSMDASNLLKPLLGASRLRVVGSTTHKEYHQYFEKDSAFARRLQKIVVVEPSETETFEILQKGPVPALETFHKVQFQPQTIQETIKLAVKHFHGRYLPDKAIDILDEAAAAKKLKTPCEKGNTEKNALEKKIVDIKDIQQVVAKMAQIKPQHVTSGEEKVLKEMDSMLKQAIFGQEKAIEAVTDIIRLSRAGLRSPNKPVACYLFSGPTGVGKTEIALQLSKILGIPLMRFDMSEYMEKHSVARLIGSPPGYVGFEQGGLLTDAISKTPHCVLLLDEIEKADHQILTLLLQAMQPGKITDHNGKEVDFKNVILLMTTNAGSREMSKASFGFEDRPLMNYDETEIKRLFLPEFLNRLDGIIAFEPLHKETMLRIVDKFIVQSEAPLLEKKVQLEVTQKARQWLLDKGFDEKLGARPLERTIETHMMKPISKEILFGSLTHGGRVCVDATDNNPTLTFVFSKNSEGYTPTELESDASSSLIEETP